MGTWQELLERVQYIKHFAVPIDRGIPDVARSGVTRTPTQWLIPCTHTFCPPATEHQLETLRDALPQELPLPLQELLQVTNGAELFRIHYPAQNSYWIARYKIFSCNELL